jgi:putative membrane protein
MTMKILSLAIAATLIAAPFARAGASDSDFVMKAGQAGLAEVALGNDAGTMGKSDAVKHFGQRMVTDHSSANAKLQTAAASGGFRLPAEPSAEQKAFEMELKAMQGAAFDKAYAAQAVKDHKGAVALFEEEAKSGKDADLKAFANATLPTLREHLKMAEDLAATTK